MFFKNGKDAAARSQFSAAPIILHSNLTTPEPIGERARTREEDEIEGKGGGKAKVKQEKKKQKKQSSSKAKMGGENWEHENPIPAAIHATDLGSGSREGDDPEGRIRVGGAGSGAPQRPPGRDQLRHEARIYVRAVAMAGTQARDPRGSDAYASDRGGGTLSHSLSDCSQLPP